MQVGGVGNGMDGHSSAHQVTNCIHDHDISKGPKGGMQTTHTAVQSDTKTANTAEPQMSLADMLRKALSAGKNLWGRIWGSEAVGSGQAVSGSGGERTAAEEQVMAQMAEEDQAEKSTQNILQNNPYFTPANPAAEAKASVFQKVQRKVQEISKHLTKRFSGAFSGRSALNSRQSSLNAKQQRQKEDLRKHSRYRDRDLEIDCVLTDDSYLMDSYDRKGEYSKLTTHTKR